MRIWSLHPKYLDGKGLVALWRETLLARKVLQDQTIGYKNHPQLLRFRKLEQPVSAIDHYLQIVWLEARNRNYHFDPDKFSPDFTETKIPVTSGQLRFESKHLLAKLKKREPARFKELKSLDLFEPNPLFCVKPGEIEDWERL